MPFEYKGYQIESNNFSNKLIKPVGKGSVHKELRGLFTSSATAKQAIDAFLDKQPTKGVRKNDTTKDSDRTN